VPVKRIRTIVCEVVKPVKIRKIVSDKRRQRQKKVVEDVLLSLAGSRLFVKPSVFLSVGILLRMTLQVKQYLPEVKIIMADFSKIFFNSIKVPLYP
jgi:hypothetical protein